MFRSKDPQRSLAKFQAALQRSANRDKVLTDRGLGQLTQPGSGLGMKELVTLILDLKKDVRKMAKTQSLQGAKEYALKQGYAEPTYTDLNKDGVNEIIIYDNDGNPKVVNGYAVTQSNWAFRNKYYDKHSTAADRKAKSSSAWLAEKTGVTYNAADPRKIEEMNDVSWLKRFGKAGYKSHVPKNRSSYNVLVADIIKAKLNDGENYAYKKGILFIAAYVWEYFVVYNAISKTFGAQGVELWTAVRQGTQDPSLIDALKKLKSRKEYKDVVWAEVMTVAKDTSLIDEQFAAAKDLWEQRVGR